MFNKMNEKQIKKLNTFGAIFFPAGAYVLAVLAFGAALTEIYGLVIFLICISVSSWCYGMELWHRIGWINGESQ